MKGCKAAENCSSIIWLLCGSVVPLPRSGMLIAANSAVAAASPASSANKVSFRFPCARLIGLHHQLVLDTAESGRIKERRTLTLAFLAARVTRETSSDSQPELPLTLPLADSSRATKCNRLWTLLSVLLRPRLLRSAALSVACKLSPSPCSFCLEATVACNSLNAAPCSECWYQT